MAGFRPYRSSRGRSLTLVATVLYVGYASHHLAAALSPLFRRATRPVPTLSSRSCLAAQPGLRLAAASLPFTDLVSADIPPAKSPPCPPQPLAPTSCHSRARPSPRLPLLSVSPSAPLRCRTVTRFGLPSVKLSDSTPARPSSISSGSAASLTRPSRGSHPLRRSSSVSSLRALLERECDRTFPITPPEHTSAVKHPRSTTRDHGKSDESSDSNGPPPARVTVHTPTTAARKLAMTDQRPAHRPVSPARAIMPPDRAIMPPAGATAPPPGLHVTLTRAPQPPVQPRPTRIALVIPRNLFKNFRRFRNAAERAGLPPPPDPVPIIEEAGSGDESDDQSLMETETDPRDYFRRAGVTVDLADLRKLLSDFMATRQALEEAQKVIQDFAERASDAEGRVAQLQEQVGKLSATERALQQQLASETARANGLQQDCDQLQQQLSQTQAQLQETDKQAKAAELDRDALRIQAEGLRTQLDTERAARSSELQAYTAQSQLTDDERNTLRRRHADELQDRDKRIAELTEQRDTTRQLCDALVLERDAARTDHKSAVEAMQQQADAGNAQLNQLRTQAAESSTQINQLRDQIQEQAQTITDLRRQAITNNSTVQRLRTANEDQAQQVSQLLDQVQALQVSAESGQGIGQFQGQGAPSVVQASAPAFVASFPQTGQPADQEMHDETQEEAHQTENEGDEFVRRLATAVTAMMASNSASNQPQHSKPSRRERSVKREGTAPPVIGQERAEDADRERRRRRSHRDRHGDSGGSSSSSNDSDDDSPPPSDADSAGGSSPDPSDSDHDADDDEPNRSRRRHRDQSQGKPDKPRQQRDRRSRAKVPLPPFSEDTVLGWMRAVKALRRTYTPNALWRAVVNSLGTQFYSFVQGTGGMPATVDEILAEIKHRYDYKDSEHAESTLRSMAQRAGESAADFIIRTTQVARKAIRKPDDEKRMVRVVIDGCRQPIKGWLLLKEPPPRSFRDLELLARNYDLAFGSSTGPGGIPVHAATVPQPSGQGPATTSDAAAPTSIPKARTKKAAKRAAKRLSTVERFVSQLPDTVQVAVASAVTPPRPCPHCGANHWASTCPRRPRANSPVTSATSQSQPTALTQPPAHQPTQQQPTVQQPAQQPQQFRKERPPFNPDVVCTKCLRLGHVAMDCWVVQCMHCHNHGHHVSKCPFLHAAPPPPAATFSLPTQVTQATARAQQAAYAPVNAATVASPQDDERAASAF